MVHYDSDYQVRKAILAAVGGDATKHYHSVYDIDIAILEAVEGGGGGGMTWDDIKAKLETSGVTSINFTNGSEGAILDYDTLKSLIEGGGGVDWDTIKGKLAEDGVDAIKFNGNGLRDYDVVTYVGKNGSNAGYFDPEYSLKPNTKMEVKVTCPLYTLAHPAVMKALDDSDYSIRTEAPMFGSAGVNLHLGSTASSDTVTVTSTVKTEADRNITAENFKLTVDGKSASKTAKTFEPVPICFGWSAEGAGSTMKYREITIYEDSVVVKHFVPVQVGAEYGFVDTVEQKYYPTNFDLVGTLTGESVQAYDEGEAILDYETLKSLIEGGASGIIDDEAISTETTWSSTKLNSILGDVNTALESIIGGSTNNSGNTSGSGSGSSDSGLGGEDDDVRPGGAFGGGY